MSDKKLVISVKSDLSGAQGLTKFLGDLSSQGNKAAKALQQINLGGAGPGAQRGGLAKSLLEQKNLFKDLGDYGQKLARIFSTDLNNAVQGLDKRLVNVNDHLKKAIDSYDEAKSRLEQMESSGASMAEKVKQRARVMEARQDLDFYSKKKMDAEAAGEALRPGEKTPFWKKDLLGGAGGNLLGMLGLGGMAGYSAALGIGALGVKGVYGAIQDQNRQHSAFEQDRARIGQSVGSLQVGLAHGSLPLAWTLKNIERDPMARDALHRRLKSVETGTKWESAVDFLKMSYNPNASSFDFQKKLSGLEGNVRAKEEIDKFIQERMAGAPLETEQMSLFQAQAGQRVSAARRLGSMGDVDWANSVGAKNGMTEGEAIAIQDAIVSQAGRGAGRRLRNVALQAVRAGLTDAAGIAGATATDQNILSRLGGTGLDVTVQSALGRAVAAGMGADSMTYTGSDRLAMLAAGISPGMDSAFQHRALQQNIMGDRALGGLMAGHDPYQQSVNLVNAVDILGPGAGMYAQNALATSLKDTNTLAAVMNGRAPRSLTGMGISVDEAQAFGNRTVNSLFRRYVDDGGNGDAGKLAREVEQSGDLRGWLSKNGKGKQGADNIEVLSGVLSQMAPDLFPNPGTAAGFLRQVGGLGGGPGKMGAPGGGGDGAGGSADLKVWTTQLQQESENFREALRLWTKDMKEASDATRDYQRGLTIESYMHTDAGAGIPNLLRRPENIKADGGYAGNSRPEAKVR